MVQKIGVLGLPELANALKDAGVQVFYAPTAQEAAKTISKAVMANGALPIVLADEAKTSAISAWLNQVLQRGCQVALVRLETTAPAFDLNHKALNRFDAPTWLSEVFETVGAPNLLDGQVIYEDGSVTAPEQPAETEDEWSNDWEDEVETPTAAPKSSTADWETEEDDFDLDGYLAKVNEINPPTPKSPVAAPARPVTPSYSAPTYDDGIEAVGVADAYSPVHGKLGDVILVVGAKGGVGKTTISAALAQRAAKLSGKRVVLVDGNRGQGDIRIYLGMARSGLPTLYDAALENDVSVALLNPDRVAAARPPHMERLYYGLVLAPPQEFASAKTVTTELYRQAIEYARTKAELVVIDSQIVEGSERGMFDDLFIPLMKSGAWVVGISDLSTAGVSNLITNMASFKTGGVPEKRLMTMLNRVPASTGYDEQSTSRALNRYGRFVASVPVIDQVHSGMAHGADISENPTLSPVLDDILFAATGNTDFTPKTIKRVAQGAGPQTQVAHAKDEKSGLFTKLFKK